MVLIFTSNFFLLNIQKYTEINGIHLPLPIQSTNPIIGQNDPNPIIRVVKELIFIQRYETIAL